MTIHINQIVENKLSNGRVLVCKVITNLGNDLFRIADVRDCDFNTTPAQLIAQNKTWAAPVERLSAHDEDCAICHKNGFVHFN